MAYHLVRVVAVVQLTVEVAAVVVVVRDLFPYPMSIQSILSTINGKSRCISTVEFQHGVTTAMYFILGK